AAEGSGRPGPGAARQHSRDPPVTAQLAAVADPDSVTGDELAVLRGVLRQDFLARAGWDPVAQVLTPVRGDPLLSLKECAVAGCAASTAHRRAGLCVAWR